MIERKCIYRVRKKEGGEVTIFRLDGPDAVGNTHWTLVARLEPYDVIRGSGGRLRFVKDAKKMEILQALGVLST